MSSIFSRLYAQRPSQDRNQLEDFLTEAFAHALRTDKAFRNRWIKSFGWPHAPLTAECTIETQTSYPGCRPDLELLSDNYKILVECKIESPEGVEQLQRYGQILANVEPATGKKYDPQHQVLVYLTRHYDPKPKPNDFKGHFVCYRWFQVFELISDHDGPFTLELKQFLKELDMAQNDNFTYHDLDALLTIHGTIRKMDKALDLIRPLAMQGLKANFYPSNRSTSLQRDPAYYNNAFFEFTHIDLGFSWWANDNEVYLYAAHFVHKKTEAKFGRLQDVTQFGEQCNWLPAPADNRWTGWYKNKPLSQVLSGDKDHIIVMEQWFKERVNEWIDLNNTIPEFFKNMKIGPANTSDSIEAI